MYKDHGIINHRKLLKTLNHDFTEKQIVEKYKLHDPKVVEDNIGKHRFQIFFIIKKNIILIF